MGNTKHTPGPWFRYTALSGKPCIGPADMSVIAYMADRDSQDENKGNEALIMAAPELLAALKELWRHTPDLDDLPGNTDFDQSFYKAIIEAQRVIIKAGESLGK